MRLNPVTITDSGFTAAATGIESWLAALPETASHPPIPAPAATDDHSGSSPNDHTRVFEGIARSRKLNDIVAWAAGLAATEARRDDMSQWRIVHIPYSSAGHGRTAMDAGTSEVFTDARSRLQEMVSWRLYLDVVMTGREIIDLLRELGRTSVADRLIYLEGLHDDDPDEPLVELESLRTLASFVLSEGQLPDPEIGLTPRGLAVGQWRILPDGILAMEFLPNDWIRFAGIGCAVQPFSQRRRISGELEKHKAIDAVRDFTGQLARQL